MVTLRASNVMHTVCLLHTCKYIPYKYEVFLYTLDHGLLKYTDRKLPFLGTFYEADVLFLKEYCSYRVETFRRYSSMTELSAHLIRRYGRMRVILDWTSKLKFI